MSQPLFSYNVLDTPIHRLSGLTKLLSFLLLTFAVMFSFDIRVVVLVMLFSLSILGLAKIRFSQIRLMVIYVIVFMLTNAVITYFFSPEEGVKVYGSRHVILKGIGRYSLTMEQLLYQGTKLLKYVSVIPLGITFLLTTNPSEFASALSGVGVHYKAAYAVSLTLRYFPDVQREYRNISLSQQARGLDMSRKAGFMTRVKNALLIIIPLVFSTLDRVELISNAMDLRGFGKLKKRSWFSRRKLGTADFTALAVSLLIFLGTLAVSVFVNHSRFYNPFL